MRKITVGGQKIIGLSGLCTLYFTAIAGVETGGKIAGRAYIQATSQLTLQDVNPCVGNHLAERPA